MREASTLLRQCFAAAVSAASAAAGIRRCTTRVDGALHLTDGSAIELDRGRLVVLAIGKAAAPMAAALVAALEREPDRGLVVTKDGHGEAVPGCRVLESAHPVPDTRCLQAVDALLGMVTGLDPEDQVLCCLTGGASALVGAPAEGLALADVQQTISLLLASGADIHDCNVVRRHLTRLGGGGLLVAARPARVTTLAVSDVLGDDPATIGSGPTWSDASTFGQAIAACRRAGIWDRLPAAARARLEAGATGGCAETLKPGDPRGADARYLVVAANADAAAAAGETAVAAGCALEREARPLVGDAATAGRTFARRLLGLAAQGGRRALVAGGETTVVLPPDHGRGGRNQQFALAAAEVIAGHPVAILAAGTDGSDGPTDAAGAIVDGTTWARIPDARRHLERCDAYAALDSAGALLRSGPTGTNVMDLAVGLTPGT